MDTYNVPVSFHYFIEESDEDFEVMEGRLVEIVKEVNRLFDNESAYLENPAFTRLGVSLVIDTIVVHRLGEGDFGEFQESFRNNNLDFSYVDNSDHLSSVRVGMIPIDDDFYQTTAWGEFPYFQNQQNSMLGFTSSVYLVESLRNYDQQVKDHYGIGFPYIFANEDTYTTKLGGEWLAHEMGHILGLFHVFGRNCERTATDPQTGLSGVYDIDFCDDTYGYINNGSGGVAEKCTEGPEVPEFRTNTNVMDYRDYTTRITKDQLMRVQAVLTRGLPISTIVIPPITTWVGGFESPNARLMPARSRADDQHLPIRCATQP